MAPTKRKAVTSSGKGLKQGNLFSFFSAAAKPKATKAKNDEPATATKTTSPATTTTAGKSTSIHSTVGATTAKPVPVGTRIQVYWPDDDAYYDAVVEKVRGGSVYLSYQDDGHSEWVDLEHETYRLIDSESPTNKQGPKRRRIQQDDDDDEGEFEFDGSSSEDDDDSSAYQDKEEDEEDDDDDGDQWMVSDEEDDQEIMGKKVAAKKVAPKKTTKKASSTTTGSNLQRFSAPKVTRHEVAPESAGKTPSRGSGTSLSTPNYQTPQQITPASWSSKQSSVASSLSCRLPLGKSTPGAIPMYTKGAVNPAGSHVHNHLAFLQRPKDAQGRTPDDALYDPRTLRVVASDLEAHDCKMTHAVKQWWDLKKQYFDTVLLFKTGKFYEMFHMDADVGVQVLNLMYMKGHVAHAGFPEISYGTMADKLVRAGYKVARVEQTETPAQLKERKQKHKGGNKPQVVNREVCSIMTLGTRTFCYLDDENGLLEETSSDGTGAGGPLLAIREVMLSPGDNTNATRTEDGDEVRPVCEYGITMVDAVRGTVTIGQFADDILRSRMDTLMTSFRPSEVLLQGGEHGASPTLIELVRTFQTAGRPMRVEMIHDKEGFPKSTAINPEIRRRLERSAGKVHPWDVQETLQEVHRRRYYPVASKKQAENFSVSRWPKVLRAAVEGEANFALSSFGAVLFYLQRNLIDAEILSMGLVKAYIPPVSTVSQDDGPAALNREAILESQDESGILNLPEQQASPGDPPQVDFSSQPAAIGEEESTTHLSLDGTTLHNLEILTNSVDYKPAGSLWSLIDHTKTPHGSRLLRAWLLRPLFRKADIDRRADAVQELTSGAAAVALSEAMSVLSKCGDIERLLNRVHSMSGCTNSGGDENDDAAGIHPNERAVLYETDAYTKRKVGAFSKLLNGLHHATRIPEIFKGLDIKSGLLRKIVLHPDQGGCFPEMLEELDWYFNNFDCDLAAKGMFEPSQGVDELYDNACETIERIETELNDYKDEMCAILNPRALAKSSWKYANTKPDSKDKYLIELPASVCVPDDFILKGKRGKGPKQVNKYRTAFVEQLVEELETALDVQKERKAQGMKLIFAKFDSSRALWELAAKTTSMLDAIGSLARASSNAGYTRPVILECPANQQPCIQVVQGRHPCVEKSLSSGEFVPNDMALGTPRADGSSPRVLLLSGVNMGGKSTCLRQTCLIAILAQIGCYVPADECSLTPVDRIYTRLGASDRILLGQSTFFVELAETAVALRGATRRSLVIMDELGRGTSTFDGTAIASAAVKHLVDRSKCLTLFATHYHSLLDEWKNNRDVRLGHMECVVDNREGDSNKDQEEECNVTFLYTLGDGGCPKSFGINVAKLANLPTEVLVNAKRISADFEDELNGTRRIPNAVTARSAPGQKAAICGAIQNENWEELIDLWKQIRS